MTGEESATGHHALGPVGRAVRALVGVAFLGWLAVAAPGTAGRVLVAAGGVAVGLVAVYALVHVGVVRWLPSLHPAAGAVLALLPSAAVFLLGGPPGRFGAVSFWAVSLLVASERAVPGCEVMVLPGMVLGDHVHLPCAVLTPIDRLEERVLGSR